MYKQITKYLLLILGVLAMTLGIIGAILPVLPTTPFLILALACFAKSSPRFHRILLNNRWFGPALQQWEENRTITRSSKLKAMILVIFTFSMSIGILHGKLQLQIGLFIIGGILLFFLWRLKEDKKALPVTIGK